MQVIVLSASATAQTTERLPLFAVDLHAATIGLPQAEGWVPVVSATTKLPGRYWGLVAGANVYPFKLGIMTIGVGLSLMTGRHSSEPLFAVTSTGATTSTPLTPPVHTGTTHLAPQVSINFGRRLGWSYLSAGMGRSKVTSRVDEIVNPAATTPAATTPVLAVPDSWNSALNFGGGAKWFMKPHLGASFDARFIKLASRSPTDVLPSAKRTQLWNISVGISIQ